jgi:RND family efflux transporter MFP subunit
LDHRSLVITVGLIGGLMLGTRSPAWAADPNAATGLDAVAAPQYDKKLAFAVAGRVGAVKVKPGQAVQAGQLLMELEDDEGQALVELFKVRAASDVEQRIAEENLRLAKIEESHLRDLLKQNAASPIEWDRAVGKMNLAALDIEKAKQEQVEFVKQLDQARSKHEQYRLLAPVSGVVEEVNYYEAQSVEPAKPVVRLVVTDPLWIDVAVPTGATLGLTMGATAQVHSPLPGFDRALPGKVILIAQVGDAASETRLIRVEVPNPTHLPAGTKVTVDFPGPGTPGVTGHAAPPGPAAMSAP